MSVKISGKLLDGAGIPVSGCAIELRAKKTSPTVVVHVTSSNITGSDGAYTIMAEPGYYSVTLHRDGYMPARAGDIYVAPTDKPDTLNVFLDAPKDGDLRPEVMKQFEKMVNQVAAQSAQVSTDAASAASSASAAASSKSAAATSATAAETSATNAAASASASTASAAAAKASETAAKTSETASKASETAAKISETNAASSKTAAATSEANALSSKNAAAASEASAERSAAAARASETEIEQMMDETLKKSNNLSEIKDAGSAAQKESRDNIGALTATTTVLAQGLADNATGVTPAALSAVLRNQGLLRPDLATAAELTDINAAVGKTFYYINGRALTNYSSSYGAHSIISFSSATGANDGAVQLVVTGPPATPELSLRVKRGTSWYQQSLYTAALLGTKLYDLGTGGGGIASLSGVPEGGTGDMRTDWQQCVTKQYAQQVTVRTGWPVSSAVSADNGGVSFHVPGYNHNGRILITDSNKMFFQTGNSSAPLYRSWVQVAGQIDINNIVIGNLIYATTTAATLNYGDTVSGSTLKPAGVSSSGSVTNQVVPPILSGTYQCLGSVTVSGQASLFMRVL